MKTNTKPYLDSVEMWGKYGELTVAPSLDSAVALEVDNLRSIMNTIGLTDHIRLKNAWPSVHLMLWYENLRRRIAILPPLNITHDPDRLVRGRIVKETPARLAKGRWEVLIP